MDIFPEVVVDSCFLDYVKIYAMYFLASMVFEEETTVILVVFLTYG